jgi:uncharacterized protein YkwD/glutaredoxin
MKTTIGIILIKIFVFLIPIGVFSQNNYTWNNKISLSSWVRLNNNNNDYNSYSAWSKAMNISMYSLDGMKGTMGLSNSLRTFLQQYNYITSNAPKEFTQNSSIILGAYSWAEKNGENYLIGLMCDVNYSYYFICEVSYVEGMEDIAMNTLSSLRFGTSPNQTTTNPIEEKKPTTAIEKKPAFPFERKKTEDYPTANKTDVVAIIVELVNQLRSEGVNCGDKYMPPAKPITSNEILTKTALAHSGDMNNRNYFAHTAPEPSPYGVTLSNRVSRFGYSFSTVGENIAKNTVGTPQSYFEQWKKSPGHCSNMMNPNFKEIGYGVEGEYATMVLGSSKAGANEIVQQPTVPQNNTTNNQTSQNVNNPTNKSKVIPIVYGRLTCGNCSASMARFKKEGIEYIFYDVDADPAKNREMWSLIKGSTSVSLPVIKVNDKAFPGGLRDIEEIIRLCK